MLFSRIDKIVLDKFRLVKYFFKTFHHDLKQVYCEIKGTSISAFSNFEVTKIKKIKETKNKLKRNKRNLKGIKTK